MALRNLDFAPNKKCVHRCNLENLVPARRLKPEKPVILTKIPKTRAQKMAKPVTRQICKTRKPEGKIWPNPHPIKPQSPRQIFQV